jgi:hypothetical protein
LGVYFFKMISTSICRLSINISFHIKKIEIYINNTIKLISPIQPFGDLSDENTTPGMNVIH